MDVLGLVTVKDVAICVKYYDLRISKNNKNLNAQDAFSICRKYA